MTTTAARPTLRRTCEGCGQEYRHEPITASGIDQDGERVHLMACGWYCLETLIHSYELCGASLTDF